MKKYMRFSQQEKYEIILLVEGSDISANRTLKELGIHKRTFYNWYASYQADGYDALATKARERHRTWNKIPDKEKQMVIDEALEHVDYSSRELAWHITDKHKWYISESSVYRILKASGLTLAPAHIVMSASSEYHRKTSRINEMWQTDFSYFHIVGRGWYYLSTVMDDYSRFILSWDLRSHMTSNDVKPSIEQALAFAGLNNDNAPVLLSDNGKCYIASEFRTFLKHRGIKPINGKPCHPQTQGKIERYHRTMKNVVKLDVYYSPEELKKAISEFVIHYNYQRYHESLNNLTPADVYYSKDKKILVQRRLTKNKTLKKRRTDYVKEKLNLTLNEFLPNFV